MNESREFLATAIADAELHSELLILSDGRILVHNLTQPMALALQALNPGDDSINPRAETKLEFQTIAKPFFAQKIR